MVRFARVGVAACFMCHPQVLRSHQRTRYNGGNTLKSQDNRKGLRAPPLNWVECGAAYHNYRTITTLEAVLGLTLQIRRCLNQACPHVHHPHRPEQEGRLALPKHECGLDVIAFIGQQRYGYHRSVPEIHQALRERRVAVAPRTVTISWSVTTNWSPSRCKTRP